MIHLKLKKTVGPKPTDIFDILIERNIVGMCQLRHKPGKSIVMPEGFENHVYCEINPAYQNKGYATETLRLLLSKARELGLQGIIVTSAEDNLASQKVIEKNGGTLQDTKPSSEPEPKLYKKYVIKL